MSLRSRRGLLGLLAGGALALLAGRWMAGQYADWAFFRALDAELLWRTKLGVTAVLAGLAFVAAATFAFANLYAVRQSIVSLVLPRQLGGLEIAEAVPTTRLTVAAAVLSVLIGIGFALLPHDWAAATLAWDGVPFGEIDPFLERDLGFYVAWIPWERAVQARVTAAVIAIGMLVVVAYSATPSIRWDANGLYVSTWVRRHLSVLTGVLVVLVGWDWRLDRYERLSAGSGMWSETGLESLFSAYDHRIALPYLGVASFASLPIAAVLVWAGWRGYVRIALSMLSAMILAGPIATAVLPMVARGPLSTPEARRREAPYLRTASAYTRRAYGVDEIAGGDSIRVSDVSGARLSASVSIWDPAALTEVLSADPRGGAPAGLAWRTSASGLEAIVLRRPNADAGGANNGAGRWHADPVRSATADDAGRPYLAAGIADAQLGPALIFPGARGAVVVSDTLGRFSAPSFETTIDRLALTWDLQDPRLLFKEIPGPRARLVTTRDVRERIARIAPFLQVGPTVVPHLRGDSLYWFADLFVTSARYPLSQAVTADGDAVHYAKFAATAVVQAQTGAVILLAAERPDPVMQRWMRRFPNLFVPLTEAADWIRRERPPAVDQMLVQGAALARVGFTGDSLGRRRLARPDDADADLDEGTPTFFQFDSLGTLGWAVPVDLPWSGRTLGVLVAKGGLERRSEFHAAPGPRWDALLDSLQQAAEHAGFGRDVPHMRRGRVQAIPTERGPAWVQSYYEWPPDAAPRLAGVVVTHDGQTRAGRSLAEALGERSSAGPPLAPEAFRERVARLYDALQAAQRAGDWRAYGDAWAALGRLLGRP